MANMVNPSKNMSGGGNVLYTHYVSISQHSPYADIAFEYRTSRAEPFASVQDLADELIAKGFTTKNKGYIMASGDGANGRCVAISIGNYGEEYTFFRCLGMNEDILFENATITDIVAS